MADTKKKINQKAIIKYKLDPSSSILCEDALKSIVYKYNGKGKKWNSERLLYAAPIKQSPFGDFPKSFLKPKSNELVLMDKENHKDTAINERHKKIKENIF